MVASPSPSNWAAGIYAVRNALGITGHDLALAVERSKHHVQQVESGQRLPSLLLVERLTQVFRCKFEDLQGAPSALRLHEIRAAYHRALADREDQAALAGRTA